MYIYLDVYIFARYVYDIYTQWPDRYIGLFDSIIGHFDSRIGLV